MADFYIKMGKNNMDDVMAALEEKIRDGLELCGQQAERNAKTQIENNPHRVDTGLLRNSITHAAGGAAPAISFYKADNPSRYADKATKEARDINYGRYSGTAPNEPDTMFIGTNVEYAPYVHEGTIKMAANRFLRDAMDKHTNEYKQLMERVLKA